MVHLFIHLLLKANNKDGSWRGIKIARGQRLTGRKSLHEETGISEQSIRTSLKNLKNTKELTIKSTKHYSLITIVNYEKYQKKQPSNSPLTNQRLTNGQPTLNHKQEEYKKERKKDIYIEPPSLDEVKAYFKDNGYNDHIAIRAYEYYNSNDWKDKNGNKVKNWKQKMIGVWFKEENKDAINKQKMVR